MKKIETTNFWIMFEFEDNLSTGFHDVFLSKYSVSRIIHDSHTIIRKNNTQFCKMFILDMKRYDTIKLNSNQFKSNIHIKYLAVGYMQWHTFYPKSSTKITIYEFSFCSAIAQITERERASCVLQEWTKIKTIDS